MREPQREMRYPLPEQIPPFLLTYNPERLMAGHQSLAYRRRQLGHSSICDTQHYAHLERRGHSQADAHTETEVWVARAASTGLIAVHRDAVKPRELCRFRITGSLGRS